MKNGKKIWTTVQIKKSIHFVIQKKCELYGRNIRSEIEELILIGMKEKNLLTKKLEHLYTNNTKGNIT